MGGQGAVKMSVGLVIGEGESFIITVRVVDKDTVATTPIVGTVIEGSAVQSGGIVRIAPTVETAVLVNRLVASKITVRVIIPLHVHGGHLTGRSCI
jgi:hypothetical protein